MASFWVKTPKYEDVYLVFLSQDKFGALEGDEMCMPSDFTFTSTQRWAPLNLY